MSILTTTKKTNEMVRRALKETGLKQWELADILGTSETILCRKLRYELSEEEQADIVAIIKEVASRRETK